MHVFTHNKITLVRQSENTCRYDWLDCCAWLMQMLSENILFQTYFSMCSLIIIIILVSFGSPLWHDDVFKRKHFPRYWSFVRGIHRSLVNSPHKGEWRGAVMFSLICVWINGWVNNREAGDLRHYRAHYGITVMVHECLVLGISGAVPNLSTLVPGPTLIAQYLLRTGAGRLMYNSNH